MPVDVDVDVDVVVESKLNQNKHLRHVARHGGAAQGFLALGRSLGRPGEVPGEAPGEALGEAPLELRAQITGLGKTKNRIFSRSLPGPPCGAF